MTDKPKKSAREWVATETMLGDRGEFYEAGGVYPREPRNAAGRASRQLEPDEAVVRCPRCGQRFATVEEDTAEGCRDLHVNGDESIPSICGSAASA